MLTKSFDKFENKVWLSSPTMHGEEIKYIQEAYDTNWMSTVGANLTEEIEKETFEAISGIYKRKNKPDNVEDKGERERERRRDGEDGGKRRKDCRTGRT